MKHFFLASFILLIGKAASKTCYWDSDCSVDSAQCCVNNVCHSSKTCSIQRDYPRPNFSVCYHVDDCESGCCHNGFCT